MTNTPLSEREKELVEAGKRLLERLDHDCYPGVYTGGPSHVVAPFRAALKAYDPKPEKEYTMPEWDKFVKVSGSAVVYEEAPGERGLMLGPFAASELVYNAIRDALSKPKAPTE